MQNLRELALVNLRSLPPELGLADLENLNKLEISGIHARLSITGLNRLTKLRTLM